MPSRLDIRDMFGNLTSTYPKYEECFYSDDESETSLQAEFASLRVKLAIIRDLLNDVALHNEFIEIWESQLKQRNQKASALLLFRGIYRLFELKNKGLPVDGRAALIGAETRTYASYREVQRAFWKDLTLFSGNCKDWQDIFDGKQFAVPPLPLAGIQLVIYCKKPSDAAIVNIRTRETEMGVIRAIASYNLESNLSINFRLPSVPELLGVQIKCEPGSDPVEVVCRGFRWPEPSHAEAPAAPATVPAPEPSHAEAPAPAPATVPVPEPSHAEAPAPAPATVPAPEPPHA